MADGDNLIAKVPLSSKKSFGQGDIVPQKMKICSECYYQLNRNLIIYHNFTNFLEDYNRYRTESFSVHYCFNRLSKKISHFVLAQTFIISTCLRFVDIFGFCQFSQRL